MPSLTVMVLPFLPPTLEAAGDAALDGILEIGVTMHNQQAVGYLSYAKRMKEKHGGQPDLPVEAIEALERGEIAFDTDSDYVKALCTRHQAPHVVYLGDL